MSAKFVHFWIFCLVVFTVAKISVSSNTKVMLTSYETSSTQHEFHSGTLRNEDSGIVYMNLTYERKARILTENVRISLKVCPNYKSRNYDVTVFETGINLCRSKEKSIRENTILRVFGDAYKLAFGDHLEMNKCPWDKGITKITELKLTSDFFPPFPSFHNTEGRIKFSFMADFYGKVEGTKSNKSVRLYMGRANGVAYNSEMFKSFKDML